MLLLAFLALAAVAPTPAPAAAPAMQAPATLTDARQLGLGAPDTILQIDTGKLKGEPAMLAWSADGSELYIQGVERDRQGRAKSVTNFLISLKDKSVHGLDQPPPWATQYWAWKSGQNSPGSPAFRIAIESREETKRAVSVPTGGNLARGGTDAGGRGGGATSSSDMASAADQTLASMIYSLKLGNETLGEWTNEAVIPGLNFGWAPAPRKMIAFTRREGGPIFLLDDQGHKQELTGAKTAILPAWSQKGDRLAWMERRDKKHYEVMIAPVTGNP